MQTEIARSSNLPKAAVGCGVLAVAGSILMYWLVVPAALFGLAAIALGWRGRRKGDREISTVAITLGVVALLLVPGVLMVADGAEDWGRDCALDPASDPNC